jgi:tetratricopeptide (TPR) repeat protein
MRERVPLDWAGTQNNLGNVLATLGKRESGTRRLEEAVSAFREALEERIRERVPLEWAQTQNNLGNALQALGQRESGTKRLEEALVAVGLAWDAYRKSGIHQYDVGFESRLASIRSLIASRLST